MADRAPDGKPVQDELAAVFSKLFTRESSEEVVRLLRERNRILEGHIDALTRGRNNGGSSA